MKKKLLLCLLPFVAFSITGCNGGEEEPKDYVLENWDLIVTTIAEKGYTSTMHMEENFIDADVKITYDFTYKYDIYKNWTYSLEEIRQEGYYNYVESYKDFSREEGLFVEYKRTDKYMDFTKDESTFAPGTRGAVIDGKRNIGSKPEGLAFDEEQNCYFHLDEEEIRTEYRFDEDYNLLSITTKYDVVYSEDDEIPGRCHTEMTKTIEKIGETVVPAIDPKIIANG